MVIMVNHLVNHQQTQCDQQRPVVTCACLAVTVVMVTVIVVVICHGVQLWLLVVQWLLVTLMQLWLLVAAVVACCGWLIAVLVQPWLLVACFMISLVQLWLLVAVVSGLSLYGIACRACAAMVSALWYLVVL
jgi:hypothetical protein